MFTIKLYRGEFRQDIWEAQSFTVLRYDGENVGPEHAEVTIHMSPTESRRVDIYATAEEGVDQSGPPRFTKAIIENRFGKTTEVIAYSLLPSPGFARRQQAA